MARAVCFKLASPLASWSEAGVALKPTDRVPSWSAVTGMVGAACGWRRGDDRLPRFAADYAMAVRVHDFGTLFEDYQTIETPEAWQATRCRVRTRFDELTVRTRHFTITRREYLSGASYGIALVPLLDEFALTVSPEEIAAAFASPVFPLYAGRRSCALGALRARVVTTDEAAAFIDAATHWDQRLPTERTPSLVRERRDMPAGVRKFAPRLECIA